MSEVTIKIKADAKGAKNTIGGLADDTRRGFRDMEKSGTRLQRSWKALKKNWLAVTAGITGSLFALKKAWDTAFDAARFQQMRQSFHTFAASHGVDSNVILANLKRVSAGTIDTAQLMEAAGNAMLLGIPADKLTRMMEIARASSRITGRTIAESFNDIALGMGRQSKLILDNLGIIIRVEKANKDYAESIGKVASQLTDAEKKQAFLNAVMEAGEDTMRRVNVQALTQAERMQRIEARWKDAGKTIGGVLVRTGIAITLIFQSTASLGLRLFGVFSRLVQGAAFLTDAIHITSGAYDTWGNNAETAAGAADELHIAALESFDAIANYGKLEEPIKTVKTGIDEITKAITEQIKTTTEAQSAQQQTLDAMKAKYQSYSDAIIAIDQRIKKERLSTEEIIRDLQRTLLAPGELRDDKRLEAEQNLSKARKAFAEGDAAAAAEFARKSKEIFASLGDAVKDGDRIIETQSESVSRAIAGVTEAQKLLDNIMNGEKKDQQGLKEQLELPIAEAEAKLAEFASQLKELNDLATTHKVEIDDTAALSAIEALKQDTSSTHTVFVKEVQTKQTGGPIHARTGRHLSGYGGGDRIPLLAEAGEYIVRKEAVRHYGRAVFDSLNRMSADGILSRMSVPAFANGGIVPTGASGGAPGTSGGTLEFGTVNLNLDGKTYPLKADRDVFKGLTDKIGNIKASRGHFRPPWEKST